MKLTRASTYALHAVVYMAGQQKREQPVPSHLVAKKRGIPERFLLKVLKPLVSAQILYSVKGPNGGYRLARSPRNLSVLEIVEAVDGRIRGQAPGGPRSSATPLHRRLKRICSQAAQVLRQQLAKIKIADLT